MELPKRKPNRLTDYDYSTPNVYFLTVCTQNKRNLFWKNPHATILNPQDIPLSHWGQLVANAIANIPSRYPAVSVDCYVIMPNHVHMLLCIHQPSENANISAKTVSTIMNQWKGFVSKQVGFSVWQKGFYDHIIRCEADYIEKWKYIAENPMKRTEDEWCMEID